MKHYRPRQVTGLNNLLTRRNTIDMSDSQSPQPQQSQQDSGIYADSSSAHAQTTTAHHAAARTGWVGWVVFGSIMMLLVGIFHAISGLVAIFRDQYFLVTNSGLIITANYTQWGWVHLILGVLVIIAGLAVMQGALWARLVGVALASISAIANLLFLGAYPLWSLLIITLDILVIYAFVVHGSELRDELRD